MENHLCAIPWKSAILKPTKGILSQAGALMKPLTGTGAHCADITGWEVFGMPGKTTGRQRRGHAMRCWESGTTCRLLTAVLAGDGLRDFWPWRDALTGPLASFCAAPGQRLRANCLRAGAGSPPFLDPGPADWICFPGLMAMSGWAWMIQCQYFRGLRGLLPWQKRPLCCKAYAGRKAVSSPISWPDPPVPFPISTSNSGVERRPG